MNKSSIKPIRERGKSNEKLFCPKINEEIKLEDTNANPPPLGFNKECELLSFGISGIIFVKGFIINLVKYQLRRELIKKIKTISKII